MYWDPEQYWKKAVRYVELSDMPERDPWERPFWLSLALEFLARAALTKVHPALNADPGGDGEHLLYAFGIEVKRQPKSLPIHAVLLRLEKIIPDSFTRTRREFCDYFVNLRNQELHTGELPFDGLATSKWLAHFYDVCLVLCGHLGKAPEELLGATEAQAAKDLVTALASDRIGAVKRKIAERSAAYKAKPDDEQARIQGELRVLSRSWSGTRHEARCPACGNPAQLQGSDEIVSRPFYDGEQLLERVTVRAHRLECFACGLILRDVEELLIAEIAPRFEYLQATELHDYHEPDYYYEYDNM